MGKGKVVGKGKKVLQERRRRYYRKVLNGKRKRRTHKGKGE